MAIDKISLNSSLTPDQITALQIQKLSENKSVRKINNEQELKDFFDED